jgi:subtilisin family serine protease
MTHHVLRFDPKTGARQAAALAAANLDGRPAAPGEIVIAGRARRSAAERLRRRGWTVTGSAGDVLRCAHPTATRPEVERVCGEMRSCGVAAAPNHLVVAAGHIKFTGAAPVPAKHCPPPRTDSTDGAGVRVAVLDTGIDPRAVGAAHGWLAGIPVDAGNSEGPGPDGLLGPATGHGTFCAGIVRQIAPACDIVAVRVLGTDGVGTDFTVARAIFALADSDDPPQIVNLSMTATAGRRLIATESALAELAANHPHVTVVAAAGNDGGSCPVWPAAAPSVLAVGSLAAYSNHGPWVHAAIPAEGVVSTAVTGVRATPDGLVERHDPYVAWTGTSFAAPQLAGTLAALASRTAQPVC